MIAQYKNLSRDQYLHKFFEIIDCMQPDQKKTTSPLEKKIMIEFLSLPDKFKYFPFGSIPKKYVREKIKEELGVTWSNQNLNNKVYSLISKGILWRDEDSQVYFKPFIKQAVEKLDKALEEGKHYDFTFRFRNETKSSK